MCWIIDILNVGVPILTGIGSAFWAVSKSKKNFENEIQKSENDLEKRMYKYSKAYDCQLEAFKNISLSCAEIWDEFNALIPIYMTDHEIGWSEGEI